MQLPEFLIVGFNLLALEIVNASFVPQQSLTLLLLGLEFSVIDWILLNKDHIQPSNDTRSLQYVREAF